jgi:hypothetical protein
LIDHFYKTFCDDFSSSNIECTEEFDHNLSSSAQNLTRESNDFDLASNSPIGAALNENTTSMFPTQISIKKLSYDYICSMIGGKISCPDFENLYISMISHGWSRIRGKHPFPDTTKNKGVVTLQCGTSGCTVSLRFLYSPSMDGSAEGHWVYEKPKKSQAVFPTHTPGCICVSPMVHNDMTFSHPILFRDYNCFEAWEKKLDLFTKLNSNAKKSKPKMNKIAKWNKEYDITYDRFKGN